MRVLNLQRHSGPYNMALDQALFEEYREESSPVIRFYGWNKPTLSLGYFQRSSRFKFLENHGDIGLVRRLTGGRGVIHHLELTYSFIAGYDDLFQGSDLIGSYSIISDIFKRSFNDLGVEIGVEKVKRGANSDNCFEAPSLYEIKLDKYKVIGSAQYRKGGKFLQHGSIILDVDYDVFEEVFKISRERMTKAVKGINSITGENFTVCQIADEIKKVLSEKFRLDESVPTEKELKRAEELVSSRYSSKDWTFKR